jgi:hypothetical protein
MFENFIITMVDLSVAFISQPEVALVGVAVVVFI